MPRSIGNVVVPSSRPPTYTVFQAGQSGSYTSPAGCSYMIVEMCGAGGGGGCSGTIQAGSGGGGAAYLKHRVPPGTYSYSVPSIAGGALPSSNGSPGGDCIFGSLTAQGGGQGLSGSGSGGGVGGNPLGSLGVALLRAKGGDGGSAFTNSVISAGGNSFLGNTQTSFFANNFQNRNGYGYGAGGIGSTSNNGVSGDSAPGIILIQEFY